MQSNYQDQAKRVIRSFNKLYRKNVKIVDDRIIDNYYHFFQDCYHLKDWLINDKGINKEDVNLHFNVSILKITQSIATFAKHFMIKNPNMIKNIDLIPINIQNKGIDYQMLCIKYDNQLFEALLVAINSLIAWNVFFEKNGIKERFKIDQGYIN